MGENREKLRGMTAFSIIGPKETKKSARQKNRTVEKTQET